MLVGWTFVLPQKLLTLAVLAIFVLPLASSEEATELDQYLECQAEKKVDIVFVFDSTNSMGGEISELRSIINKFAAVLEKSNIDYELGLVEFRDFPTTCDDLVCGSEDDFAYRTWGNGSLTSDITIFRAWVRGMKAGGGGQVGPEASLAALWHAHSDMAWRNDASKVIILLTDAGPHPDGSCCNAEGDTLNGTILALAEGATRVYVVGPDHASLKKIATDTGGQFYEIRSGLSLMPILEDITQSLVCSFNVTVEATCEEDIMAASVRLVGKEIIPYVTGQTEAWMYIDQSDTNSRRNLFYNSAVGAYQVELPDVCGSLGLTVYGRVGTWSAAKTMVVKCRYPCEVTFQDPNLESAVRAAIHKPEGNILRKDIENLVVLNAGRRAIENISGLEQCENLERLNLEGNHITNISYLSQLTKLETLKIGTNPITDISSLSGLMNLTTVDLGINPIKDISPLSGLTNLTSLVLDTSYINNLWALSKLTNLKKLYLLPYHGEMNLSINRNA
jgi:Leucine-rich repeat (LRR) protein